MRHLGIPRGVCDPCGRVGEWGCEGCPVVLVRKVVEYDSGGAVGVECDSEEVGKGSVSPRGCAAEAACAYLPVIGWMLASLGLIDCRCASGCCLDLYEVREPLDATGC